MFCFEVYTRRNDKLLAVCDSEILDETLENSDVNYVVDSSFYGEKEADSDRVLELAEKCSLINAIGNEVVQLLVDNDFVDSDRITKIDGIDHAQVVKV